MTIEPLKLIDEALILLRTSRDRDEILQEIDLLETIQWSLVRHFNRQATYDRKHDVLQQYHVISILSRELA